MNNLGELIEALEGLAKEHGADAQLRIAVMGYRSNMEYCVEDVVGVALPPDGGGFEDGPTVVYLVQATGELNLPTGARRAILGDD